MLFRSFEQHDNVQSDFWTVKPDGSDLAQLTHYKAGTLVLSASYSPDGEWIAHATNGVGDNADVFVMRADGTGARPVDPDRAVGQRARLGSVSGGARNAWRDATPRRWPRLVRGHRRSSPRSRRR